MRRMRKQQAARQAGRYFIRSFPNQYEEQVGEGGNLLSFGQKQLISWHGRY